MVTVTVDADKAVGSIKPMHCINNAPICGTNTELFPYLKKAGIPFSRLHDTGGAYGGGRFVDIHNVFRDFDADEEDEASYDFAFTDWLLCNIVQQGTVPFFRLGTTIENGYFIRPYYIYPPRDYIKWAKICEKIILHYNEGWANGFHMGIEYWEIWNEPDNHPVPQENPMWQGNMEQYFELYRQVSVYLKNRHEHLKIGGYGSCGMYAILKSAEGSAKEANVSPRFEYFIEFMDRFLSFVRENACPLDFFSWHSYGSVSDNIAFCRYVRQKLDDAGFYDTESILDEWNPGIKLRGTLADMAKILEMLLVLQNEPVDMLMYYDGQVHGSYQGLFNPVKLAPYPALYALQAFDNLYRLGTQVEARCSSARIRACAARSEKGDAALLIVNPSAENIEIRIEAGKTQFDSSFVIDNKLMLEEVPIAKDSLILKSNSAILMKQQN